MRRVLLSIFLIISLCGNANCGTKRALTVFIGDYPKESGWNTISSQNDKAIILEMLYSNGFKPSDVTCLEESRATCSSIVAALENLASSVKSGDQVYVHFSCHGQQITDQDGDEALVNPGDRYDEAIVPYDAAVSYGWHGYKGEKHLTDDVLNDYFSRIQKAVGAKGCLLVVNDSCHSGSSERADGDRALPPYRGSFDAFEQPLLSTRRVSAIKPVTWISVTACKDFQTNFEVNVDGRMYGRLSYAISRCFRSGIETERLIEALKDMYDRLPISANRVQSLQYSIDDKQKSKVLFNNE